MRHGHRSTRISGVRDGQSKRDSREWQLELNLLFLVLSYLCVKYIVKSHSKVIVTMRSRWRAVPGIVPLQLLEVLPRLDRALLETPWEND